MDYNNGMIGIGMILVMGEGNNWAGRSRIAAYGHDKSMKNKLKK